jgi:Uma2 family endonuclease
MSVAQQERLLTAEEFWEMPGEGRWELVEGVPVEMPGSGGLHSSVGATAVYYLKGFVREHRLGVVSGADATYLLGRDPDRMRVPDASFVSRSRLPEGRRPEGFWPFAPDLAVEVVSPSETARDLHAKIREYLAAGTRLVWVLWPEDRAASVYRPDGEGRYYELGPDDELSGEDVLPGFRIRVADLFEPDY